jgi:hypothetical protein
MRRFIEQSDRDSTGIHRVRVRASGHKKEKVAVRKERIIDKVFGQSR